jgi:hypothetical protein
MIVVIVSDQVELKSYVKDLGPSKWLTFEMPIDKRRERVSKVLNLIQSQSDNQ